MTVESASYISQLDTTLPTAADLISEGDDHLRLMKTVLKTQFPNFGTVAITASAVEVNYLVGVTSGIQAQFTAKANKAGETYTGAHNYSGASGVTLPAATTIGTVTAAEILRLSGVASPLQTQIDGKGAITGQAWTGAHSFAGAISVPTLAAGTNTTGAASTAFVQADFLQKFPNYTAPVTASTTELNYLVGLTGAIQPQLSNQVAGPVHAATSKATPVDADELGLSDSAASWGLKKLTFANLKAWLTGLFVPRAGGLFGAGVDHGMVTVNTLFGDGQTANVALGTPGTAQGQRAGMAFYPTFTGTKDNKPRRAADIWASFNGIWGAERLSFGTGLGGVGNDTDLTTLETLALTGAGEVLAMRGPIGYGVGAGGTVVQATSKSTGVTLNRPTGQITMNNSALDAGKSVGFVLYNSLLAASDVLLVTIQYAGISSENYSVRVGNTVDTAAGIYLKNESIYGFTLSEAVVLNFAIIKRALS